MPPSSIVDNVLYGRPGDAYNLSYQIGTHPVLKHRFADCPHLFLCKSGLSMLLSAWRCVRSRVFPVAQPNRSSSMFCLVRLILFSGCPPQVDGPIVIPFPIDVASMVLFSWGWAIKGGAD